MGLRGVVITVAVCGLVTSSCASTARDTLVDVYDNEAESGDPIEACGTGDRCGSVELDAGESSNFGQDAIDRIDEGSEAACVTDQRLLEVALETHFVLNGYDARTMADLLEFGVEDEMDRWMLQAPSDGTTTVPEVVPITDGPCDR